MKSNQPIQRKPKLAAHQIESCFMNLLRIPELFAYAKQHLQPRHFSPVGEMRYVLVWRAALAVAARNNGILPTTGLLHTILTELLSIHDTSADITVEDKNLSIDMLVWMFDQSADNLNKEYNRSLLQDLIVERIVIDEMSKEVESFSTIGRPVDIIKSLENYNKKLQAVLADHANVGDTAFPTDFKPKKIGKFSTGLPWYDTVMNGGQAPAEVYVLLGPTGAGKSLQGIMLAVSTARVCNPLYHQNLLPRPKVSCFFSWEQDTDQLRPRFWSYAGRVDVSRLEMYADEICELSTTGKLEKYELEEFSPDEIKQWGGADCLPGEKERLAAATAELNEIVKIYDFSGAADNPRLGEGGIDEVATALRKLQDEGKDIGMVVLDYAGAAVRRMMSARGEDPTNIRHHLVNFCNEARFKIAVPFNCPVWVLHQLNTEANRRSATAPQHHSYASECGNFAENAWFAFVLSTKDKASNICQLHCTKTRRAKGDRPPSILRIEGQFGRVVDISSQYTVDDYTKQFIPKDIKDRRVDVKSIREREEKRRPGSMDIAGY